MTSRTVHARLDDVSAQELATLTAAGRTQSEVVRHALIEAARRRRRRSAVATDVTRLASDPADSRVRHAVLSDMTGTGDRWPA